uniref:Uncharacterized protein n=1 Tax=Acrobeloides nanus TaxID=290746 RepID=A0A914ENN7_9BILA
MSDRTVQILNALERILGTDKASELSIKSTDSLPPPEPVFGNLDEFGKTGGKPTLGISNGRGRKDSGFGMSTSRAAGSNRGRGFNRGFGRGRNSSPGRTMREHVKGGRNPVNGYPRDGTMPLKKSSCRHRNRPPQHERLKQDISPIRTAEWASHEAGYRGKGRFSHSIWDRATLRPPSQLSEYESLWVKGEGVNMDGQWDADFNKPDHLNNTFSASLSLEDTNDGAATTCSSAKPSTSGFVSQVSTESSTRRSSNTRSH